jgi:hypothetical protein
MSGIFSAPKPAAIQPAPVTPAEDPAAAAQREAATEAARKRAGSGRASTVLTGMNEETGTTQSAALRLLGGN